MNKFALGIDVGTTSVKVLLISGDGQLVYETSAAHDLLSSRPGWAEQKTEDWWANTILAVRNLLRDVPEAYRQIEVIGVSGMVPAIVMLDDGGRPLRHSIQQNDARAVQQIERLKKELDQDGLFERTGGLTNQQHVLPRLLWVKENEPETWAKTTAVMGSYDYINYKLTGAKSLEINWAVESGLFDIRERIWLTGQMWRFGVPSSFFPEVRLSGEFVGVVSREAASLTGLREGIPVIAGSADHVASTLAAGITGEGDLLIKFGGAGDILYCTNHIQTSPQLFFDYHIVPNRYLLNGCMSSSGSLVKWYVQQFLKSDEPDIFKKLDIEATAVAPGSGGLVILPYFLGEKTPIFDPQARGVFFGLTLSHGRGHLFRAILEAVIYGFRHHVEVIESLGYRPKRIFATNGGAKSSFWCQIASDVLKSDVRSFPAHPGSALGVAFLAGMSVGMFSEWREIDIFLRQYEDYAPIRKHSDVYDQTYGIYRDLYRQLGPSFEKAGALRIEGI